MQSWPEGCQQGVVCCTLPRARDFKTLLVQPQEKPLQHCLCVASYSKKKLELI
jgi:hypothetical protein